MFQLHMPVGIAFRQDDTNIPRVFIILAPAIFTAVHGLLLPFCDDMPLGYLPGQTKKGRWWITIRFMLVWRILWHISNVSIGETCCYLWIREYIKTLNVVWIMHLRIYALGFIHLELVLMIMESIYLSSIYMCNLFRMLNEP